MTPEPTKFDVFDSYLYQLPTRAAALNLKTQSALKLSDFASLREWHRTDLYNYIFRANKLSYQLGFYSVHDSPQVGVSLNRSTRDFSEDERTILDLLRPHIVNAYRTDQFADYLAQRPEMAGHEMLLADDPDESCLPRLWLNVGWENILAISKGDFFRKQSGFGSRSEAASCHTMMSSIIR